GGGRAESRDGQDAAQKAAHPLPRGEPAEVVRRSRVVAAQVACQRHVRIRPPEAQRRPRRALPPVGPPMLAPAAPAAVIDAHHALPRPRPRAASAPAPHRRDGGRRAARVAARLWTTRPWGGRAARSPPCRARSLVAAAWQTGAMPILTPFLPESSTDAGQDAIVDGFVDAQESVGRVLYPHQEEAP